MADQKGDPSKQPAECGLRDGDRAFGACRNLKEISGASDMNGETYHCDVCGEHFRLYYEDMA